MRALQEVIQEDDARDEWETTETDIPLSREGKKVSEAEYWEKYYEHPDFSYEWKNGYLEVKPVSDYLTFLMYKWFFRLLDDFLAANPVAKAIGLEFGFRLELPYETVIRKPDLAVVMNDNPAVLGMNDCSYAGIFDLCIEAVSRSSKKETERDTKEKKSEYCAGCVREYYILDGQETETAFYRLDRHGKYVHIKSAKGGIIKSRVLNGFQFRKSDLYSQPSPEEMADDAVYQAFVLTSYQREKQRAEKLEKQLYSEREKAAQEREKAEREKERAERLAARLRKLGISDE